MEEVKKNGSMLYLCIRSMRASRREKGRTYFVPSIFKTGSVKSSTNNDRTRIFGGLCKFHHPPNLGHK